MKKLMLTISVVVAASAVHAAAVTWASGTITKPGAETSTGSGIYKFTSEYTAANKVGANGATMYVWVLGSGTEGQTAYNALTSAQSVYDTYWGTRTSTTAGAPTGTSKTSAASVATYQSASTYGAGEVVYAALLFEYSDGNNTYWAASKDYGTIGSVSAGGDDVTVSKTLVSDSTKFGWKNAGWQMAPTSPTPEPTSAMLMLLGMAGLALRRKHT